MKKEIIDLVFPDPLPSVEEIEAKYPARQLPNGAVVTRTAPSPTGYLHLGTLSAALIPERVAHQSGGVFFLRVEDTDQKRKVNDAVDVLLPAFKQYGIEYDEGPFLNAPEKGAYGPYFQSARKSIYQAYIKKWLEEDKAYLCFCTEEENEKTHEMQSKANIRPGYYGPFAKCRKLTEDEILKNLQEGKRFVVRFKSPGHYTKKIVVEDLIRGKREFPENDLDIPVMKGDGLPTYHFAHLIDDHLMGTTIVLRGEEWLSSLPLHIQLFQTAGWRAPKYAHISHIQKLDENGNRRKLSKRLDPEANVTYFDEKGYPKQAIVEYLLNLANSNFEDWRRQNPLKSYKEFPFSIKKMGASGALFDFVKLDSISRELISHMSAEEVYNQTLEWCEKYDVPFATVMRENADYMKRILDIERSNTKKPRKDIAVWSDVKKETSFFFDNQFALTTGEAYAILKPLSVNDINNILKGFMKLYNPADDKNTWFDKIKQVAAENGFTCDMKAYRENPSAFKGSVADVASVLRVFTCGKTQSADLYAIMQVMGADRLMTRLSNIEMI